eukprot:GFYU01001363.1.p1 GENE.GFYU01001363.1~~GFYU01001363.1.p1  ORF type:complete len:454 (-),score=61.74 GFYU01001363.1:72-1433(-)
MRLDLSATTALWDELIDVRVLDAPPGATVTIRCNIANDERKGRYSSTNSFLANNNGVVDLGKTKPITGDYRGVVPMGIFESLVPEPGQKPGLRFLKRNVMESVDHEITVECEGQQPVQCVVHRYFAAKGVRRVQIRHINGLRGAMFFPPGEGPFPGVLDLYGTNGGLNDARAALIASHGFVTFALAYLNYEELSGDFSRVNLQYFQNAAKLLNEHPSVQKGGIGVIGTSFGAHVCAALAARCPVVTASTLLVGSHMYMAKIEPEADSVEGRAGEILSPGWVWPDYYHLIKPVEVEGGMSGIECSHSFDPPLTEIDTTHLEIPIENANGPVQLISADADLDWPASDFHQVMWTRLRRKGFAHLDDSEHVVYSGAGHLIEPSYSPFFYSAWFPALKQLIMFGGNSTSHLAAQRDSWPRILKFLAAHTGKRRQQHLRQRQEESGGVASSKAVTSKL